MAGIALAARMQKKDIVTMTWIGDGGTSTGAFHEGINFAAVQKLPLVIVAENNGWAYSTPVRKQTAAVRLADKAAAYGIPGETVDGNDVLAVYDAARRAVDRARSGGGPDALEAVTYRMKGHAEHDAQAYVPKEELEEWRAKDPIERYARALVESGAASANELAAIDQAISEEVDREVEFAEKSPLPAARVRARGRLRARPARSRAGAFGLAGGRDERRAAPRRRRRRDAVEGPDDLRRRDPRGPARGDASGTSGSSSSARTSASTAAPSRSPTASSSEFGEERVIDTPIAETAIVGAAVGAAMMGMRPVAEMQFIDFISCAFDMITNFAAKSRYRTGVGVPLVIRGPSGGGVHGGPFHSQNPEAYFAHTPGLKVVQPATAYDAKGLIKAAIRDDDPVLFFEHKFLYRRIKEELPAEDYIVPIGKAAVRRTGRDLSIITYGAMVWTALEAAKTLEAEGIDAEVVDLRTLFPMDEQTVLDSVAKTNKAILLHEATRTGGIGAEIAAVLSERCFEYLDGPLVRVTAPDTPVPYSPPLEEAFLPNAEKLCKAARALAGY